MSQPSGIHRREFARRILSACSLVVSAQFLPGRIWVGSAEAATLDPVGGARFHPSIWMGLEPDGTVIVVASRSEMGSGSRTSPAIVLADELEADWKRVRIEQAIGDAKYGSQNTDGSHSIRQLFDVMRQAGATARTLLEQAAAQRWGVPAKECAGELHVVVHKPTGRRLGYGELASAAAKLPMPAPEALQLKPRKAWRYIGKETSLYDLEDMCTGKAVYGIDARMEGMLYASVERPPVLGGTVRTLDDAEALRVSGVKSTVKLATFKGAHGFQPLGGVAVIADSSWAALQGRSRLKIEWEHGPHAAFNSADFRRELEATVRRPGKAVREVGDVDAQFKAGGKVLEAGYYTPLLAHVPMEPPAAVAEYRDGKVVTWAATQNPQEVQSTVANVLGIKPEDVTCHVTLLGGGFGRKSKPDYVAEAALLSKAVGRPVKIVWSREDDIRFDYFHSPAAMFLKAAVDQTGMPVAWLQRSAFPPITSTFVAGAEHADSWELDLGWRDLPFAIPHHRAENGAAPAHVRIGWLRAVANVYHAFAVGSFVDELARAAGKDPLDYLLALIGPDRVIDAAALPKDYSNYGAPYDKYPIDTGRLKRVLRLAAEKAGWGKLPNAKREGMGIAVHRSFLTYVATVVRVQVDPAGKLRVVQVDTAVDAGTIVNRDTVIHQFEGAAVFGASLALHGEITAAGGIIEQSNFADYQLCRFPDTPEKVSVHLIESEAPPGGVGEPGVPPFAPALCNAIFAATGKRVRELPISKTPLSA